MGDIKRGALSVKRQVKAAVRILARLTPNQRVELSRIVLLKPTMQELIDAHEVRKMHGEPRLR